MGLYGFAIFSGAFLLFLVQPLLGKYLLPWFGGAPAVWTACLLMFQSFLLLGYLYAHLSTRWLKARAQLLLHLALLLAALTLPVAPSLSWKPATADEPTLRICALLIACAGLPFIVLSATAPLLQHWLSLDRPGKVPFRLYAWSNAGSLLALLSYPLIIETFIGRANQVVLWRAGLILFAGGCVWLGFRLWKRAGSASQPAKSPKPSAGARVQWIVLPACASLLLAAVTNKLCQDIAPIPLLWVLPLSAYLLSFVLCFSISRVYDRRWFGPLLLLALAVMSLSLAGALTLGAKAQVLVFTSGLFVCSMVCHGEVFRARPDSAHLTFFYLLISVGGVLGTAAVILIAPRVFHDYFELHWGLLFCGALFLLSSWPEARRAAGLKLSLGFGVTSLAGLGLVLWSASHRNDSERVYQARNFYGVLSVYRHRSAAAGGGLLELVHGRVAHGVQFIQPDRARIPTLYYTRSSGVGVAFEALSSARSRRVGVVGLGAGTLAAYLHPADHLTFYEINPAVKVVAETFFSFLKNCTGSVEVVLGDARLSLEKEPSRNFDLLVLDAFNSDSIPVHLLTREAFAVYRRHTRPDGVIAVHVSNMVLDFKPVISQLAREFGYSTDVLEQPLSNETEGLLPSTWILLSQHSPTSQMTLASSSAAQATLPQVGPLWTDDFNGLFPLMRWRSGPDAHQVSAASSVEPAPSRTAAAITRWQQAVAADPNSSVALNNLACLLATAPEPSLRDGAQAVKLAERACALTQFQNSSVLSTLAAAYAEVGRFDEAVSTAERAGALAAEKGEAPIVAGNRQMLEAFRRHQPFHQGSL